MFILETLSIMSRQRGVFLLLISIVFLLCGYLMGGFLIELNRRPNRNLFFIEKEYIYSIVYGALFYTALVTLVKKNKTNFESHHELFVFLRFRN